MLPTLKLSDNCSHRLSFPFYQEPKEIGTFCLGENRNFILSNVQPKYLISIKDYDHVRYDLNLGYDQVIKKDFSTRGEKLDNLLKWIAESGNTELCPNFICYRGLLTTLLCTPYENQEGWIICVIKYQNVIYLCQFDTESKIERESNSSDKDKLMSSWGYKFEQYLTCDYPGGKSNTNIPVNENEEFCCVVKTRLNSHSIVFGAEMDCVDPNKRDLSSMNRYLELKTSRMISSQRQERNFHRFKLLKWWAQSFLIGIENIICGFRDDGGIVHNLQTFNLREIAKTTKDLWNASVCMNFCDKFLSHVKQIVKKDDYRVVYKFEWYPNMDYVSAQEMEPNSNYCFLPDWYIEKINCKKKNK